jgi:hypothetical protein
VLELGSGRIRFEVQTFRPAGWAVELNVQLRFWWGGPGVRRCQGLEGWLRWTEFDEDTQPLWRRCRGRALPVHETHGREAETVLQHGRRLYFHTLRI